jgi:hypothetical protein
MGAEGRLADRQDPRRRQLDRAAPRGEIIDNLVDRDDRATPRRPSRPHAFEVGTSQRHVPGSVSDRRVHQDDVGDERLEERHLADRRLDAVVGGVLLHRRDPVMVPVTIAGSPLAAAS